MKEKLSSSQIMNYIRILLATQLNYLVAVAVIILGYGMFSDGKASAWRMVVLAFLPLLYYVLRCKLKTLGKFLLGHLFVATVFCFLLCFQKQYMVELIIYPLIVCVYLGLSFHWKGRMNGEYEEKALHPALELGALAICLLLQQKFGDATQNPLLLSLTIVYLCLYFVYYYLDNYFSFMKVNQIGAGRFQGKRLLQSGIGLAAGYIVVGSGLLFVCTNQTLVGGITNALKNVLYGLLRLVFLIVPKGQGETQEVEATEEYVEGGTMMPSQVFEGEGGIIYQIIDVLLGIAVFCVIAAFLCVFVWAVIRIVRKFFKDTHNAKILQMNDAVMQQTAERLEPRGSLGQGRKFFEGFSPNARIRKVFARFMQSKRMELEGKKRGLLPKMTARECGDALMTEKNETSWQALTFIYEQARYSEEECSTEQLRAMKKAIAENEKR